MTARTRPRPLASSLAALLALLLAACAGGDGSAEPTAAPGPVDPTLPDAPAGATAAPDPASTAVAPSSTATPTSATPGPASATPVAPSTDPDPAAVDLALQQIASLEAPIATAVRDGDPNLYVAERAGRVRALAPDGTVGAPLVDISGQTTTSSERGLLGLAWNPAGDRLYLSSTDAEGATVLDAVDVVDGVLQGDAAQELLRVPQPAGNHNGGHIAFGPDGNLWLGLGDGGGADDEFGQAQDPSTLLGSMLRLDVEGAGPGEGYAIPPDNPFADGGGAPEVWAYGLRNPWRWTFDPPTGQLWVADVGQNAVEEVDRVPADAPGLNYGWPRVEGDRPFDGRPLDGPAVEPVHTYTHARGCSITGGVVYRGAAIPALQGAYLYSDFCAGTVHALDLDAAGAVTDDVDTGMSLEAPVHFGHTPDGEVVVLSITGPVYRIVEGS